MKLNIVCAITADPLIGTNTEAEAHLAQTATMEYEVEQQRGTWNKTHVKFFVTGDIDDFFEDRLNFMKRVFNIAFTEWDIEIPLVFTVAESEEDADIIIEFGTKAGDRYYADAGSVLAYAGYPDGGLKGYMKIFTDWDWNVKGSLNIITVIIHELGHLIGRPHSERRLWIDIMDPAINASNTELSDHDILGATTAYGAREYERPEHYVRLEMANRRQKERLREATPPPATS